MKIIITKKEILEKFNLPENTEIELEQPSLAAQILSKPIIATPDLDDYWEIDFPEITAKEIYKKSKNKAHGGKLFYNTDWYKNENFFTTEKSRPGKRRVYKTMLGLGKSWDECNKLSIENGYEMLNFPEMMYLLWKEKESKNMVGSNPYRYSWTSSRDSVGGLVDVGYFDSGGSDVNGWAPGHSGSSLGVCFSRSE